MGDHTAVRGRRGFRGQRGRGADTPRARLLRHDPPDPPLHQPEDARCLARIQAVLRAPGGGRLPLPGRVPVDQGRVPGLRFGEQHPVPCRPLDGPGADHPCRRGLRLPGGADPRPGLSAPRAVHLRPEAAPVLRDEARNDLGLTGDALLQESVAGHLEDVQAPPRTSRRQGSLHGDPLHPAGGHPEGGGHSRAGAGPDRGHRPLDARLRDVRRD